MARDRSTGKPSIPGALLFQGVLAWLGNAGTTHREERIHERLIEKKRLKGRSNKAYLGTRRRRRLYKLAKLARRHHRGVKGRTKVNR